MASRRALTRLYPLLVVVFACSFLPQTFLAWAALRAGAAPAIAVAAVSAKAAAGLVGRAIAPALIGPAGPLDAARWGLSGAAAALAPWAVAGASWPVVVVAGVAFGAAFGVWSTTLPLLVADLVGTERIWALQSVSR